ncbi:MAG: aldehyde ferredoxin oxidoreductase family protein [Desulfatibacillaceae bacterium]|nr:aldehyde ferredoxin oxidoreductase family protein [Desulfatibacillaceae bacterium]
MGQAFMGKVLMVDLSTGKIRDEIVPDKVYEDYLSGMGLGAYMLYKHIPPDADPLGPENMLGFVSGLLTGTGSLFTGRWMVVGKSPLTHGWGDANCGGNFSPAIKRCGYDGIFFTGKAEKPVYLNIADGKATLEDAGDLWGKDTVETEQILISRATGKNKPRVACIGPAGEKLSLISGVSNDGGRMAARSGLGAVMGSKNLKALCLSGNVKIPVANKARMKELSAACNKWVQFQPPFLPGTATFPVGALLRILPTGMAQDGMLYKVMLKKWGTVSMNQVSIEMGDSPIKNWKGTNLDFGPLKSFSVNPDVFTKAETKKYFCFSCPLGCGGICKLNKGPFSHTHKPEYETVLALGGLLLNEDADSIFYLNELLNRAGMDTISAGGTVAFAIECYEKGIITAKDTGGLALTWGNSEAIIELVEKMIRREGIGDILADGAKSAAQLLKGGSENFAVTGGGHELPMHDSRNDPGFGVHYKAEPSPGKHTIGSYLYYEMFQLWKVLKGLPKPWLFYPKGVKYKTGRDKAVMSKTCSTYMNVVNGSGGCMFGAFLGAKRIPFFDWINAATGWNKTPEQYMEIGERIQTIRQAFNLRQGIKPKEVELHDRAVGRPPLCRGANKGRSVDIETLVANYWEEFGWDRATGSPTPATLAKLGIEQP